MLEKTLDQSSGLLVLLGFSGPWAQKRQLLYPVQQEKGIQPRAAGFL